MAALFGNSTCQWVVLTSGALFDVPSAILLQLASNVPFYLVFLGVASVTFLLIYIFSAVNLGNMRKSSNGHKVCAYANCKSDGRTLPKVCTHFFPLFNKLELDINN